MTFCEALDSLKHGEYITREKWVEENREKFLFILPEEERYFSEIGLASVVPEGTKFYIGDRIYVYEGERVASEWTPNGNDILAEDWGIVDLSYQGSDTNSENEDEQDDSFGELEKTIEEILSTLEKIADIAIKKGE